MTNPRPFLRASAAIALSAVLAALAACAGGPETIDNPASVLTQTGLPKERYAAAIEAARAKGADDATRAALRRMVVADGFGVPSREQAFRFLLEVDRAGLVDALTNGLPRMSSLEWRRRVCELIADAGLVELVPTLIRAWANPVVGLDGDGPRPERVALGRLVGEERVGATLVATMRESSPTTQANLRARCWELLMKTGDEGRLRALLADPEATRGDAMLTDLARVANELGVLPTTREEILWARDLCRPERQAFFESAREALAKMPVARRNALEIRAVPLAVACARNRPELLAADEAELAAAIERRIDGRRKASPDFTGYGSGFSETFYDARAKLLWTDLAAMTLALDLLDTPALRLHLFEVADRDREDRATEYGGVIALDSSGRGEFLEFAPRVKAGDVRYESPQALFDALYTGLLHVHFHAQRYDNSDYAGPHLGDFAFAEETRCSGIVLAFLGPDELGVDFYRHGRVVVDLGAIRRPDA
jgi:hypothetical protein